MHGNISFDYSDGDLYADIKVGADTVRKKLGSIEITSGSFNANINSSRTATATFDTSKSQIILFQVAGPSGYSALLCIFYYNRQNDTMQFIHSSGQTHTYQYIGNGTLQLTVGQFDITSVTQRLALYLE